MTNLSTQATAQKPVAVLKSMLATPSVQEQFQNALKDNKDIYNWHNGQVCINYYKKIYRKGIYSAL